MRVTSGTTTMTIPNASAEQIEQILRSLPSAGDEEGSDGGEPRPCPTRARHALS